MLSILFTLTAFAVVIWLMFRYREKHRDDYRQGPSKGGWIIYPLLTLVFAFGFMVLMSLAATEIFESSHYRVTADESGRIVSLNDNIGTGGELRGSFFLGIGSVTGQFGPELAYSFYQRVGPGELQGQIVTEDGYNEVVVREAKGVVPHVRRIAADMACHTPLWINPIHQLCTVEALQDEWVFVVPRGTVLHGFKLNGTS